jgi:hypothetical protein
VHTEISLGESQVEEEETAEPPILKGERRLLPEVALGVRWMRTHAACAMGTDLRGVTVLVFTPRGCEQVEPPATVRTADEMFQPAEAVGLHQHRSFVHEAWQPRKRGVLPAQFYVNTTTEKSKNFTAATPGSA